MESGCSHGGWHGCFQGSMCGLPPVCRLPSKLHGRRQGFGSPGLGSQGDSRTGASWVSAATGASTVEPLRAAATQPAPAAAAAALNKYAWLLASTHAELGGGASARLDHHLSKALAHQITGRQTASDQAASDQAASDQTRLIVCMRAAQGSHTQAHARAAWGPALSAWRCRRATARAWPARPHPWPPDCVRAARRAAGGARTCFRSVCTPAGVSATRLSLGAVSRGTPGGRGRGGVAARAQQRLWVRAGGGGRRRERRRRGASTMH